MGGKGKPVHFISFLGTGDYRPTIYHLESRPEAAAKSRRFVQEALLEILHGEGYDVTDVSVLLTDAARTDRYLKYIHTDRETGVVSERPPSLQEGLSDLRGAMKFELHPIDIEVGGTSAHQWRIFNEILGTVQAESRLVVDVTHGFRTTPMIFILALDFLKKVRNCEVAHIWYGAYEARTERDKDEQGESRSPVVDLTSMAEILDWSAGLQNLQASGNAGALGALMAAERMPVEVRAYGDRLADVAEAVNRASAYAFPTLTHDLARLSAAVPDQDAPELAPVKEVLVKVADEYGPLSAQRSEVEMATTATPEEVRAYLRSRVAAADMLLKHKQYMQCFTLLIEALTTLSHFYTAPSGFERVSKGEIDGADRRREGLRKFGLDPARAKTAGAISHQLTKVRNALNHAYVSPGHQDYDSDPTLQTLGSDLIKRFAELIEKPLPTPQVYQKRDSK